MGIPVAQRLLSGGHQGEPMILGRWHRQALPSELAGVRVWYGWAHQGFGI